MQNPKFIRGVRQRSVPEKDTNEAHRSHKG